MTSRHPALRRNEPVLESIRRVVRKAVLKARKRLAAPDLLDDAVHGARKDLKRARAGLRLLRDVVGSRRYRRENLALRDAARPLSDVRDARILLAYRAGQQVFEEARRRRTAASLHEWRKQVKYLRHQLEWIEPVWPEALEPLVRQTRALSDRLGDDHDLVVLSQCIGRTRSRVSQAAWKALHRRIDDHRQMLQARALRLGEALYAERPRLIVERLHAAAR